MQVTAGVPQPPAIPIACRCVPTDQWLTTHVDVDRTIEDIKIWLLYKFFPSSFTAAPSFPRSRSSRKRRPMSPIRFAARQQDQFKPKRTAEEYYQEDDYDEDIEDLEDVEDVLSLEGHKITAPRPSASSAHLLPKLSLPSELNNQGKDSALDPASYTLISFSTGLVLEDRICLDSYSLQPHELLELHKQPFIINLPRNDESAYVRPYFEAKVGALKSVFRHADTERGDTESRHGHDSSYVARERLSKRRRDKLGWSDRWLLVHKGILRLSRHRNGTKPSFHSSFDSLIAVTNFDHLQRLDTSSGKGPSIAQQAFSSSPSLATPDPGLKPEDESKYIVCLKFRDRGQPPRQEKSRPTVPDMSWLRRGSSERGWDTVGMTRIESNDEDAGEDTKGSADDGVTWVILDLRNEYGLQNFIRLIHREAPIFISSTFLTESKASDDSSSPPPSPIQFAPRKSLRRNSLSPESPIVPLTGREGSASPPPSSPVSTSDSFRKSLPYPAWRLELLRRARRAGMGDLGKAMEFVAFGLHNDEDESTIGQSAFRGRQPGKKKFVSEKEHKKAQYQQGIELDDDSSASSEQSLSEQEWQDWKDDIIRRRKAEIEDSRDIQWETNWSWQKNLADSGSHTQESGASSPRTEFLNLDSVNTRLGSPPLISHSSADSLYRRTTTVGNISRPMSPQNLIRIRPFSPLSAETDDEPAILPTESELPAFSQYDSPHYLRTQHSEPNFPPMVIMERYAEVSVGPSPEESGRKGRPRTSTLMPGRPPGQRAQPEAGSSSNTGFGFFGNIKPRLRIPFQSSSGSAPPSGINSSSSPMSAESRDSLKFATPSGSDD